VDTYTSPERQYRMLKIIMELHKICVKELGKEVDFKKLAELPVREDIARMKYIPEDEKNKFDDIEKKMKREIGELESGSREEGNKKEESSHREGEKGSEDKEEKAGRKEANNSGGEKKSA